MSTADVFRILSAECGGPVYCASVPAIAAAVAAYPDNDAQKLTDALIGLHHPSLGLDRSVTLRDVIAFLDGLEIGELTCLGADAACEALEREFGGGS